MEEVDRFGLDPTIPVAPAKPKSVPSQININGTILTIGDQVWVDEGDSIGCYEFGGTIEKIHEDGTITVRVKSQAILRTVDADCVEPLG